MAVAVSYCKSSPFLGQFPSNFGKAQCRHITGTSVQVPRISALFWGSKKSVAPLQEVDFSLGDFTSTASTPEGISTNKVKPKRISVSVVSSILEVSPNDWDACALDATGPEKYNPFLTHGFLSSLEESNCAVKETGWMPRHMIVKDECENILGVVPLYLKSHSYGEFVFDHSWADAYYNFGARYYPKLQCCVPFTPVTGPRILIHNTSFKDQVFDIMVSALKELAAKRSNSSIEELARIVMEKKGVPDIIVNNAGTINKNNKIWEVPEEDFDTVIDTNVKGVANMLRHFIPLILTRNQGIIVNMSSGWGRSGAALVAPYCASKWAIEGLTRSVAKELPDGMAVIALNPGVIKTDMLESCFGDSAGLYQEPEAWALKAATMMLNLTAADNGASLTV